MHLLIKKKKKTRDAFGTNICLGKIHNKQKKILDLQQNAIRDILLVVHGILLDGDNGNTQLWEILVIIIIIIRVRVRVHSVVVLEYWIYVNYETIKVTTIHDEFVVKDVGLQQKAESLII